MSGLSVGAMFAGYGGLEQGVSQVFDTETAWVAEFDAAPSKILATRELDPTPPGPPIDGDQPTLDLEDA
ncbi:hypothetical protein [Antribacter gilvus]|uniref:hypothetical protein n=1 Tax=Antribacter gilvus TaxID=2304675 RepID=UPI000F7A22F2|nr:hypothetical protein [Antribacter gilvus]